MLFKSFFHPFACSQRTVLNTCRVLRTHDIILFAYAQMQILRFIAVFVERRSILILVLDDKHKLCSFMRAPAAPVAHRPLCWHGCNHWLDMGVCFCFIIIITQPPLYLKVWRKKLLILQCCGIWKKQNKTKTATKTRALARTSWKREYSHSPPTGQR